MKKIILLALTALLMISCRDYAPKVGDVNEFSIVVVDSCEYIQDITPYQGFLAHKGNCRFCKERRQKEMEELVKRIKEE